jgi:hypothetical protein
VGDFVRVADKAPDGFRSVFDTPDGFQATGGQDNGAEPGFRLAWSNIPFEDDTVSCASMNKKNEPCGSPPLKGTDLCQGHTRKRQMAEAKKDS